MTMTQEEELAAVKRKIRKMAAVTVEAGATEAEMFNAMTLTGELLEAFNLKLDEVLLHQQAWVSKTVMLDSRRLGVLNGMAGTLGRFAQVQSWVSIPRPWQKFKNAEIHFFGIESDVEMAIYLWHMIKSAYDRSLAEFKQTRDYLDFPNHKRIATKNFEKGFSGRIVERLCAMIRDRKAREAKAAEFHAEQMKNRMLEQSEAAKVNVAAQTTGTALMVIAKAETLAKEFKKTGVKLYSMYSSSGGIYDPDSRDHGKGAANKVNLDRPISGTNIAGVLK